MNKFKKQISRAVLFLTAIAVVVAPSAAPAADHKDVLWADIERLAADVEPQAVQWRRDFHQNPELGNREFRTSKIVAAHLKSLGLEVRTNVAKTGVVAILKGGKPGPVVALRADMDALPVTEQTGLPFASKNKGVMHACGHDNHTAALMATAVVLSKMKDRIPGTVKFIFQPAEEGVPEGEEGGAPLMIKEGALENPRPAAIFGLHVSATPLGQISYRPEGAQASGDILQIVVKGSQTHGAKPWAGVDPIVVASQIVLGIQSIVSRQVDLTVTPAVITIGKIRGGERFNIIPERVEMTGTIRVFDAKIRKAIHEKIRNTAEMIAKSAGATAEVTIREVYAITYNDPALTKAMTPTFQKVVGEKMVVTAPPITGSEDFSFYQEKVPGLFFFVGSVTPGAKAIPNHSPFFSPDERVLLLSIRAMSHAAVDYLTMNPGK